MVRVWVSVRVWPCFRVRVSNHVGELQSCHIFEPYIIKTAACDILLFCESANTLSNLAAMKIAVVVIYRNSI